VAAILSRSLRAHCPPELEFAGRDPWAISPLILPAFQYPLILDGDEAFGNDRLRIPFPRRRPAMTPRVRCATLGFVVQPLRGRNCPAPTVSTKSSCDPAPATDLSRYAGISTRAPPRW